MLRVGRGEAIDVPSPLPGVQRDGAASYGQWVGSGHGENPEGAGPGFSRAAMTAGLRVENGNQWETNRARTNKKQTGTKLKPAGAEQMRNRPEPIWN